MRKLSGGGVVAAHGHRSLALQSLRRPPHQWGLVADVARVRVVTNVVTPRCFSCGFLPRCYERRQSEGFFANNGGFWAWIDDVCNRGPREVIGIALV